ncbi:hypothetical protein MMC10_002506 [Thelotrema lepadinum]|nr:hypothetical protein [Thelotrema lepadinum]
MSVSTCIVGLPPELLDLIVCYFESTSSLLKLALTCRKFSRYVKRDGYRVFVQKKFPFYKASSDWQRTAKFLSALSRAWKTKAFVARDLIPDKTARTSLLLPLTQHGSAPSGTPLLPRQSMGYQPAIACLSNGDAGGILAWGAGAELIIRSIGSETEQGEGSGNLQWTFWKDPTATDGKHDITSLSLLTPQGIQGEVQHEAFIARAGGRLEHMRINHGEVDVRRFNTDGRAVRSAHTNSDPQPLLAVGLDGDIALYDTQQSVESQDPLAEIPITEEGQGVSTWTVKFIGNRRVGVGRGPTYSTLRVFDVLPYGVRIAATHDYISARKDSLYCIEPLGIIGGASQLLLAGWYSGNITLHDLRSPNSIVLNYEDPIDPSSPIYSLCSFANDRFVAGGGRHSCIKVFDLRMSGARIYAMDEINKQNPLETKGLSCPSSEKGSTDYESLRDYNVFLRRPGRRNLTSPVYSLAKASEYSSTFYAGLENQVMQLDLYSISEAHTRPGSRLSLANRIDESRSGPKIAEKAERLAIVEHTRSGAPLFWNQRLNNAEGSELPGWDSCWTRGSQEASLSRRQGPRGNQSLASRPLRRHFRH